jgi:K+-transporting ATPase KdpF subunit
MHALLRGGGDDGRSLPLGVDWLLRGVGCGCLRLRTLAREALMTWLYALSGIVALLITIYLVIALLFPEKF